MYEGRITSYRYRETAATDREATLARGGR